MTDDKIVQSVCDKLNKRSQVGITKYKTTLDESDEILIVRLNHLQEELMDACNYIEWAMQKIQNTVYITYSDERK